MSNAQPKGQKATGSFKGTITMNGIPTTFDGAEHYIFFSDHELEIYSGEEVSGVGWKSITLKLAPHILAGKHNLGTFESFRSAMVVPGNNDLLQDYSGTLTITPDHANRKYDGKISLSARNNGSNIYEIEATFYLEEST